MFAQMRVVLCSKDHRKQPGLGQLLDLKPFASFVDAFATQGRSSSWRGLGRMDLLTLAVESLTDRGALRVWAES